MDPRSTNQQRKGTERLALSPHGEEMIPTNRRTFLIRLAWGGMSVFTASVAGTMNAHAYKKRSQTERAGAGDVLRSKVPRGELNQSLIPETKLGKKPPTSSSSSSGSSGSSGSSSQSRSQQNCHQECEWMFNTAQGKAWQKCRQVCS